MGHRASGTRAGPLPSGSDCGFCSTGPMGVGDAGGVGRAEEEEKEAETAPACPQILLGT